MSRDSKSCLSKWYPRLVDNAIPTPRTEIVRTDLDLSMILDGPRFGVENPEFDAAYRAFIREIEHHADGVGYPCFLRTGLTSGKHRWKDTCFVESPDQLPARICNLVEFSALADMMGLPTDVWAIREYLPVEPVATLPHYGDMPLVPEMRCFIHGGKVLCSHPYWPIRSIAEGLPRVRPTTSDVNAIRGMMLAEPELDMAQAIKLSTELDIRINVEHVLDLASKVAEVFAGDGYWSVDILPARDMWFVTDMAEGDCSFHHEGCAVRP